MEGQKWSDKNTWCRGGLINGKTGQLPQALLDYETILISAPTTARGRDDLFLALYPILGGKLDIRGHDDLFFALHLTLGGKLDITVNYSGPRDLLIRPDLVE